MRPKSLVLLMLALGCGLVASIGINQVMAKRGSQSASGETTPVLVAATEIGLGDPLIPELLKLEQWPSDKVPPGTLSKLSDVEDRRTRAKFYPGEPILEPKLFGAGEQSSATDQIPNGMRVVSVKVDTVSGGSGLVLPGDRVDLLLHVSENQSRGIATTTTKTILQEIKVFAVNDVYERVNGEKRITAQTISLLTTPEEAELVTLATNMGTIRLVLRSASDDSRAETAGITPAELLQGLGLGDSSDTKTPSGDSGNTGLDLLALLKSSTAPAPDTTPTFGFPQIVPKKEWKVVVIEADQVREVVLTDDSKVAQPAHSGSNGNFGGNWLAPGGAPGLSGSTEEEEDNGDVVPYEEPEE